MAEKPKVLYHYCSLFTFNSIVSNKSIWLSDVSKSNDSEELTWIKKQTNDYLKQKRSEYANVNPDSWQMERIDSILNHIDKELSIVWTFCLSEKRMISDNGEDMQMTQRVLLSDSITMHSIALWAH